MQNPDETEYAEFLDAVCSIYDEARTNKSESGAKRRGIIVTVLASLQTRMENFTLSKMLAEIRQWLETGRSVFQRELQAIQANLPPPEPIG